MKVHYTSDLCLSVDPLVQQLSAPKWAQEYKEEK
jgi:hypothetical protein